MTHWSKTLLLILWIIVRELTQAKSLPKAIHSGYPKQDYVLAIEC